MNFVWGYGGSLLFFFLLLFKEFPFAFQKKQIGSLARNLPHESKYAVVNPIFSSFFLPSFLPSFLSFLELCRYLIVVASGHQSGRQWGRQVINITDDIPTYFFRCNLFTFTVLRRESRRPFLNFQFCLQSIHF